MNMLRSLVASLALLFIAEAASAQVAFDYAPPALGSSEVVKHNDLAAELSGIGGVLGDKLDASLVTAFALTILDDADAAAARATLDVGGLGAANTWTGINTFSTTGTAANVVLTSTDTGATQAPILDLYRDSASPIANDNTGSILFSAEDSAGNKTNVAQIIALLADPTDGSEDGSFRFYTYVGGTFAEAARLEGENVGLRLFSNDGGAAAGPNLRLERQSGSPLANDVLGQVTFYGRDTINALTTYSNIFSRLVDPTDGSEDGYIGFQTLVGGTNTTRFIIGDGFYYSGGSDPGASSINATAYQVSGTDIFARANTWTALQTIDMTAAGNAMLVKSTDAGATVGPVVNLHRDSASPAPSDVGSQINFRFDDSIGTNTTGVSLYAILDDPTDGSEDARLILQTIAGGTSTGRFSIASGLTYFGGTDQGDGTVNATGLYINGTNTTSIFQGLDADLTALAAGLSIPVEATPASGDFLAMLDAGGVWRLVDWASLPGVGGGISNVVEDLTPQLGGDLDANLFDILFDNGTGIRDESDNEQLLFATTATAVNYFQMTNSAANGVQRLAAAGSDAAIAMTLASKSTDPINLEVNGATEATLNATNFSPGANDGNALGVSGTAWADLFLASGGLIEFDGGTTNSLTCTGGNCTIEGNGLYRAGGADVAVADGGTGRSTAGLRTMSIPAGSLVPAVSGGGTGCTKATIDSGTSDIALATCDFTSTTADETGWFYVAMPKGWDEGTITAQFIWHATSGTGNVVWGLACAAVSDDDPLNATLGTQVTVTDGLTATTDQMTSGATGAHTIGGTPAENDVIYCRVNRVGTNGSDTFSGTAKLILVKLSYTVNAWSDD